MSSSCRYTQIANLFLENNDVFTVVKNQKMVTKSSKDEHDLYLVHLLDAVFLASKVAKLKLLFGMAYKLMNKTFVPFSIHV